MIQIAKKIELILVLCLSLPLLGACTGEPTDTAVPDSAADATVNMPQDAASETASAPAAKDQSLDVIARVGDQTITFHDINTMMNSAALVGLSMPELGSPERDTVRLALLDKLISANLLYLDALQQGVDKDPDYQRDVQGFADVILAALYRSKVLVGEIDVTRQDIEDFHRNNISEGTELTDELRMGIEATIRKERVDERTTTMRERLREGHKVEIIVTALDPEDDQVRSADDVVATLDGEPITWGEVKASMRRAHTVKSVQQRIAALEKRVDDRIMIQKAHAAGLEQDPVYLARYGEFSKTRLINIHRGRLLESWEPTGEQIREYYEANKDRVIVKEMRKVQTLVVNNREEAAELKQKIESGELTFHKAVTEYSIVPGARKTLGQIGWVSEGSGFPELDEVTFLLEAGEIGGPVESPAGWHLVRVLDQRDAQDKNITDERTREKVRKMLLDDKLNQYVIDLRKEAFTVDINEEMVQRLSRQEIDWYQEILEKAQKSPDEMIEEIERLRKK